MVACVEVVLAVAFLLCRVWFFFLFSFNLLDVTPWGVMKLGVLFVLWTRKRKGGVAQGATLPSYPRHPPHFCGEWSERSMSANDFAKSKKKSKASLLLFTFC